MASDVDGDMRGERRTAAPATAASDGDGDMRGERRTAAPATVVSDVAARLGAPRIPLGAP
jgi:hypothetical protein